MCVWVGWADGDEGSPGYVVLVRRRMDDDDGLARKFTPLEANGGGIFFGSG